jgi:hypothetical protein
MLPAFPRWIAKEIRWRRKYFAFTFNYIHKIQSESFFVPVSVFTNGLFRWEVLQWNM